MFGVLRLLLPEVWMRCLCSPSMESKSKLLALALQEVPLIGVLTGCTTLGQSGPWWNEEPKLPQRMQFNVIPRTLLKHRLIFICVGISQCPYCG